ncbi:putative radical SAM superfamily Fe-S cluster-containing enzyme [Staphylococcus pasteuri]|uniref:hypothetical protein n=1 Tax=Staphylococcus warneri TaxID=1292 RepID=UPI00214C4DCB|nr:hypothetical protein [Staphylococcus warneri]MCC8990357.1 hypothetical protein [Staphylococcus sp.]MCR1798345.1 hypothetical protein [Staphylococcus warneri]
MNKLQLIKIALLTALLVEEVRNAKRVININLKHDLDGLVSYINEKNAENIRTYL